MNWADAVIAMRAGHNVRRDSLSCWKRVHVIDPAGNALTDEPIVIYAGLEPLMLAAAWTDDDRPVFVFRGAQSGVMHIPEDEDRAATDWVVDAPRVADPD